VRCFEVSVIDKAIPRDSAEQRTDLAIIETQASLISDYVRRGDHKKKNLGKRADMKQMPRLYSGPLASLSASRREGRCHE
jgi:hypothetical protein